MKNTITPIQTIARIGIAVVIAVGFTSCQKECISNDETSGKLISEIFSATIEQPATKTATADGGATVTWAASDKVHYYTADAGTVRNFTITAAGASATLDLERETGDTYYNLVYAGSTTPAFTTNTSSSMVFDGVKATQDGTFANANVSVARTAPGGSSVTFKPVTAIVKFTTARTDIKTIVLTGGAGTENVAGNISVDPTASTPTATLSGTGSTSITATIATPAAGTYYINVLPGTYSSGLKLTLKDAGSNVIGTVTASNSIDLSAGGKMINITDIDSHIVVPTDLSSAGTANCYIVSAAGTYKFKTVKGNSATSVGTVAKVAVLWESFGTSTAPTAGDLVNTVSYADNYITFTATSAKGNAVIAAKDVSDNILWSWHIWVCKDYDPKTTAQSYSNSAGTLMDRNLGATSATPGEVQSMGLLYQWGRKDPFLGSSAIDNAVIAASTLTWPSAVASDASNGTIAYTIAHPTTFITSNDASKDATSNGDWLFSGTQLTEHTRWTTLDKNKSIYDPCPQGWRVQNGEVWKTAFDTEGSWQTSSNFNSTKKGMDFGSTDKSVGTGTIWYPATGHYRGRDNELRDVGTFCTVWSCTSVDEGVKMSYFMHTGRIFPSSNSNTRAYGRAVRCIMYNSYNPNGTDSYDRETW